MTDTSKIIAAESGKKNLHAEEGYYSGTHRAMLRHRLVVGKKKSRTKE